MMLWFVSHSGQACAATCRAGPRKRRASAPAPQPAKAAAPSEKAARKSTGSSTQLLPPQLTGRANAVTEDHEKMGIKRRRAKAKPEGKPR